MTLSLLVEESAENVAAQAEAIWRGDAKTGKQHANQFIAALKKLRAHGNLGRDALAQVFSYPRMDLRTAAATYLLRYRTADAKAVLEEAAKG